MSKFYRDFEDRFRGPRNVIRARLEQYTPFLQFLLETQSSPRAIDLGCGRGEWLEIVHSLGYQAVGVDLDADMVRDPVSDGITIIIADALAYLRTLPDASVALVTAFHVIEHLDYPLVQELTAEAFRILTPGGLLILETPNPENLLVAASSFYLDPTHKRPLLPQLIQFVAQFEGFDPAVVLRLQEDPAIYDRPTTLIDVLIGPSPDYSVIGYRPSGLPPDKLPEIFRRKYGIEFWELAVRFQDRLENDALRPVKDLGERFDAVEQSLACSLHRIEERLAEIGERVSALENQKFRRSWRLPALRSYVPFKGGLRKKRKKN